MPARHNSYVGCCLLRPPEMGNSHKMYEIRTLRLLSVCDYVAPLRRNARSSSLTKAWNSRGMNQKSHQASLPKKRMAAGCLFRNSSNQILIVQPTYKPHWETPGGVTEENESPKTCAAREVREELNLEVSVGRLLVVDYTSENEDYTEALMWVFDGGILTDTQIQSIKLPASELESFRFVDVEELPRFVTLKKTRRLEQAIHALQNNLTLYLENQVPT